MCGICGIALSSRSSRTLDRDLIVRMREPMAHRGPDGVGAFVSDRVALGHVRLSIVDVAHGAQPMASDDGALQLIYNGEVYNHPALHEELVQQGVRYHTRCDTETILRLYEREGTSAPRRLRGMFAFAIWDSRTRELFIARDRFGVKPVYYAHTEDGSLYFASEIKAILAAGHVGAALNDAALPDYLANHAPSGEDTLFAGIKRLPPGHTMVWKDGVLHIEQYWDLSFAQPTETRDDQELIDEYRDRFVDAVRMRLMSDVPLGMFLSGGIDSASITAAMSRLVDEPIKTFSVAFAEQEANELAYARLVAERYRTDHHEVVLSPGEFWERVPRLVWHEDEPMAHPSSVALNAVSRLAAECVKVVLTGEGSDETLAGYNRYRVTIYNTSIGRRYERLAPVFVRDAVRHGVDTLPAGSRVRQRLSRTFLMLPSDLPSLYFDNFAVFSRTRQARLLAPAFAANLKDCDPYFAAREALSRTDARSLLDRLLYADTKTYLHELLMKQDQMSMAASIESRVPFLDHPLVEFAARLPQRLKLRGVTTKYVLRAAMRDWLPREILSRKKMGFPVPVGAWLRGPNRGIVDEFVTGPRPAGRPYFVAEEVRRLVASHTSGEQNHSERLWALVNFEIWHRIFLDGEPHEFVRIPA
ncbi:MAG: Asparagine synthetase [glutamine-hydrolyzing] 1 [Gemmatimonadaceae bacterium]|nr:Asparagine synthetase [glutamine-hydrolyzing] 1 [Gemmatimonadaceae bacterium]